MTLYEQYKNEGYDFFVGIPCSRLKEFIDDIQNDPEVRYIPCTREDEAMGIAVGAYLTGKKPVVFTQNSGLGNMVDIITSLLKPYGISIHILISSRSKPMHHQFMHKITRPLLKLMEYDNVRIIDQEDEKN